MHRKARYPLLPPTPRLGKAAYGLWRSDADVSVGDFTAVFGMKKVTEESGAGLGGRELFAGCFYHQQNNENEDTQR